MGEVALGESRMPNSRCVRLRLLRTARRSAAGSCAASRKGLPCGDSGSDMLSVCAAMSARASSVLIGI